MALRYRQITGTFYNLDGTPAAGKKVIWELTENDYTLDGSVQKFKKETILDNNGSIPQVDPGPFLLWCNADGFSSSKIKITEPDSSIWYFVLEYGDGSAITKDELRAAGTVVDPSSTLSGLIEEIVNANIEDQIIDGETAKAPSQNAVFDALELKADQTDLDTANISIGDLLAVSHNHENKPVLDLLTDEGNGTNFLADDGTYKAVISEVQSDLSVLYVDSGLIASSEKFIFDGSDLGLINNATVSAGWPNEASPWIMFKGKQWDSGSSAQEVTAIRIRNRGLYQPDYFNDTIGTLEIGFLSGAGNWTTAIQYGNYSSSALNTRLYLMNPFNNGWGGYIEIDYVGGFAFKTLGDNLGAMSVVSIGAGGLYQGAFFATYAPELRSMFGSTITLGAGVPEWVYPGEPGKTGTERLLILNHTQLTNNRYNYPALRVDGHASQSYALAEFYSANIEEIVRIGHDYYNCLIISVSSTGIVKFNALGSAEKFEFNDFVEVIDNDLEISNENFGLILTDDFDKARYRGTLVNGSITWTAV